MGMLSHIIADAERAPVSNEFPGCCLPVLNYGSFVRVLPEGCVSCERNTAHKAWERMAIEPASRRRLWQQELIDRENAIKENVRRLQSLLGLAHLAENGILAWQFDVNGTGQSWIDLGWWPVTAVGAGSVTCRYVEGSSNPNDIPWVRNVPAEGGGLEVESHRDRLPARCLLKFNEDSGLGYHGGWIVRRIIVSESLALNGTFSFELETPCGAHALDVQEGSSVTCHVLAYMGQEEEWVEPVDLEPLFCEWASWEQENPAAQEYTIEASKRIMPPAAPWWTAEKYDAWTEEWTPVALANRVKISNAYATTLDLTGMDLTGIDALRISYLVESTAEGAGMWGFARCKWSRHDYTGSYGETDGGHTSYCAKGGELLDAELGAVLAQYTPLCWLQGTCPHFEIGEPTHPLSQALWRQLWYSVPWRWTHGLDGDKLERMGPPSLLSEAGDYFYVATGYHDVADHSLNCGGLGQAVTFQGVDGPIMLALWGLEQTELTAAWAYPVFGDGTLPIEGPARMGKSACYGAVALGAANDAQRIMRDAGNTNGSTILRPSWEVSGDLGATQRTGWHKQTKWFPKLAAGDEEQAYVDGVYQAGFWTAQFEAQEAEDANTVYRARVAIPGTRTLNYDRTIDNPYGGAKTSVAVKSSSYAGSTWTVDLAHKITTASSLVGPRRERQTYWRACGTNVALPRWARVRNWLSEQCCNGPMRHLVHEGDAAQFSGVGGRAEGLKFWITKATAGIGEFDTCVPGAGTTEIVVGPGALGGCYEAEIERLQSVTVTTLVGGSLVTWTGETSRTHPLAKNHYFLTYDGATLRIYFSPENDTDDLYERAVTVTLVWLDAFDVPHTTYPWSAVDLSTYVWRSADNALNTLVEAEVFSGATIDALGAVTVTELATGTVHTLTAYGAGTAPAHFADWDEGKYEIVSETATTVTLRLSPEWAGEAVRVTIAALMPTPLPEDAAYYAENVAIHETSLPGGATGYDLFRGKCDRIEVADRDGIIAELIAEHGIEWLAGKALAISNDAVALDGWAVVSVGEAAGSDTALAAGDYLWLGASGELWLKQAVTPGKCLMIDAYFAERHGLPLAIDLEQPRVCLERMFEG